MSGKSDQVKGRAKEIAGTLVGDEKLESEGKTDRRAGEMKEKLGHAKDKVEIACKLAELDSCVSASCVGPKCARRKVRTICS